MQFLKYFLIFFSLQISISYAGFSDAENPPPTVDDGMMHILTENTAPELSIRQNGTQVTLQWTANKAAEGYRLYYAPYPELSNIQWLDVGNQTELTVNLPENAHYYVAVASYPAITLFSNVEIVAIDKTLDKETQSNLEELLKKILKDNPTIPAITAQMTLADGRVWRGAQGIADLSTDKTARVQDAFEIGSITKTFTATVILQLVEEGHLKLNDPITKYFPDLNKLVVINGQDYTSKVTIQSLLQHESGITDYVNDAEALELLISFYADAEESDFFDGKLETTPEIIIKTVQLHGKGQFIPLKEVGYSNTNYILLGMLIEKLLQHPLETIFEERLFQPLNLHFTYLKSVGKGWGYTMHNYMGEIESSNIHGSLYGAAGGVISTHEELQRFFKAVLTGQLFKKAETLQRAKTASTEFLTTGGFAVFQDEQGEAQIYLSSGSTLGQNTFVFYFAKQQTLLSFTLNQGEIDNATLSEIMTAFLEIAAEL